ncbi:MAG TPA: methyltransferase domain-containing protein [Acidimicrobiales bacterium]|nr:methyltransferase domain-containing protein [Acidimicrobiales bacterium]
MANERETKRWNDDQWVAAWPKRERLTEALTPHLLAAARVEPGQRVCDIGCGGGDQTIAVAGAVGPTGQVVGLDVSAPLVELARSRAEAAGVTNVEFVVRDVQTGGLGDEPFDLAVSQLGIMFFDEPTAAFRAIRSGLREVGRLVFACWQEVEHNPWHTGTALRPFVPPPRLPGPGKSPVGPFAFGDDEYVHDILGAAGFGEVETTALEITVRAPASAVVDRSLFGFMGVPPERLEEVGAVVDAHLARFAVGDGEYEYPLAFRIYEVVKG